MAMKKRSVQVFECDDSKCMVVHYREKHETKPEGFHGKVQEVTGAGADEAEEFYACSQDHLQNALEGALARARGEETVEQRERDSEDDSDQNEPNEVEASNDLTATPQGGA